MNWGIEHFDYYLKGKKFTIITDHTALKAMKEKHIFGNLKLERKRERLHAYDFDIIYNQGKTMIEADALSRLHEIDTITKANNQDTENNKSREKSNKVIIGNDGIWYWKISDTEMRIFPKIEDRKDIMMKAHTIDTKHRGRDSMLYELSKTYY